MKLRTIWTIPAMDLGERLRRTGDWAAFEMAAALPRRVRYWAFVQVGGATLKPDEIVPDALFVDVLARAPS